MLLLLLFGVDLLEVEILIKLPSPTLSSFCIALSRVRCLSSRPLLTHVQISPLFLNVVFGKRLSQETADCAYNRVW